MPNITLPDGSVRSFDDSITGFQLATDIGPGLAKAALIMLVDGVELDLDQEISNDSKVAFITRSDDLALPLIRHDCAHVMAAAVQELFPEAQVTIGPSIENGFYYDFYRKRLFRKMILGKLKSGCMNLLIEMIKYNAKYGIEDMQLIIITA